MRHILLLLPLYYLLRVSLARYNYFVVIGDLINYIYPNNILLPLYEEGGERSMD